MKIPSEKEVLLYFSGASQIFGNFGKSNKLNIDVDKYGVYFDGTHWRQNKDPKMLWSPENGYSEIVKEKPKLTLQDLKVGQIIEHPTTGEGKILMISPRKIKIKYPKSTRTTTFTSTKAEFEIKDI